MTCNTAIIITETKRSRTKTTKIMHPGLDGIPGKRSKWEAEDGGYSEGGGIGRGGGQRQRWWGELVLISQKEKGKWQRGIAEQESWQLILCPLGNEDRGCLSIPRLSLCCATAEHWMSIRQCLLHWLTTPVPKPNTRIIHHYLNEYI